MRIPEKGILEYRDLKPRSLHTYGPLPSEDLSRRSHSAPNPKHLNPENLVSHYNIRVGTSSTCVLWKPDVTL